MKKFSLFPALILSLTLALSACGTSVDTETDSSLENMLDNNGTGESIPEDDRGAEDTPYSAGPSEIPDDLIPNDSNE